MGRKTGGAIFGLVFCLGVAGWVLLRPLDLSTAMRGGETSSVDGMTREGQPSRKADVEGIEGVASGAVSQDDLWADLVSGNERFVSGKTKARDLPKLRAELLSGQSPKVGVLTCSDSRLSPETLFDKSLGELFVVRTAGNVAEPVGIGSMEYAVENLGTKMIVVLGHDYCGAVKAACSKGKLPTRNLEAIGAFIRPSCTAGESTAAMGSSAEANVRGSSAALVSGSEILRGRVKEGKLSIVRAMYNLESGTVHRVK